MKRLKLMHDKNIGALLVVDDDVLKGILSERLCEKGGFERQKFKRYLSS